MFTAEQRSKVAEAIVNYVIRSCESCCPTGVYDPDLTEALARMVFENAGEEFNHMNVTKDMVEWFLKHGPKSQSNQR